MGEQPRTVFQHLLDELKVLRALDHESFNAVHLRLAVMNAECHITALTQMLTDQGIIDEQEYGDLVMACLGQRIVETQREIANVRYQAAAEGN